MFNRYIIAVVSHYPKIIGISTVVGANIGSCTRGSNFIEGAALGSIVGWTLPLVVPLAILSAPGYIISKSFSL